MKTERSDINFPLWRKKVDYTILKLANTPLPFWITKVWDIEAHFGHITSKKQDGAAVTIKFKKQAYQGYVAKTKRTNGQIMYRLFFESVLRDELQKIYVMSYMRGIEAQLRQDKGYTSDIEKDIPFWEFLDIEYDTAGRTFYFTAYYVQEPTFPELFKSLARSTVLKQFESEDTEGILKSKWLSRHTSVEQIHANNVIYYLIDTKNKLIYIGEAERMHNRFLQGHAVIPDWDHYRFDVLPAGYTKKQRVTLERMLIYCFATLFANSKHQTPMVISDYRLANLKIDID